MTVDDRRQLLALLGDKVLPAVPYEPACSVVMLKPINERIIRVETFFMALFRTGNALVCEILRHKGARPLVRQLRRNNCLKDYFKQKIQYHSNNVNSWNQRALSECTPLSVREERPMRMRSGLTVFSSRTKPALIKALKRSPSIASRN